MDKQEYVINEKEQKTQIEVKTRVFANHIVEALIKERKRQGITQQEIADITGMKAPNITRIESRKFTPTLDVLLRYAKAIGKELHFELVDEDKRDSK